LSGFSLGVKEFTDGTTYSLGVVGDTSEALAIGINKKDENRTEKKSFEIFIKLLNH
jgi:hypothetical protein